jgi:hypothetical protein
MFIALAFLSLSYFLPSTIAALRRSENYAAILALNLLLGWTILGWVGALVWSLVQTPKGLRTATN